MILAQINDHRNHLINKHSIFGNTKKSSLPVSTIISNNSNINISTNTNDPKRYDNNSQMKTNARMANIIKLCKTDEIHVAPCQCALRLLGMKERKRSRSIDSNDILQQLSLGLGIGIGIGVGNGKGKGNGNRNGRRDDNSKEQQRQFRHSRTASTTDGRELGLDSRDGILSKVRNDRMDCRRSGEVSLLAADDDDDDNDNVDSDDNGDDGDAGNSRSKCQSVSFPQEIGKNGTSAGVGYKTNLHSRSDSNLFTGLEYHEITLICNQGSDTADMQSDKENDDAGQFVKWDAVTIRCSTHDELDLLVKALRDSSKAKVVPFSSNPKERLEQLRAERQQMEKELCEESIFNSDSGRPEGEGTNASQMANKNSYLDNPLMQHSPRSTNIHTANEEVVPSIASLGQEKNTTHDGKEKRKQWDLNFNKKEYCELCNLTFTLLTRRHHCRKCEKSCCGHCSRLLIEKGCDERRYCNRCASVILQKQSAALRGRSRHKSNDTALPGKVHEACKSLGVGVMGRLPHWKTFLRPKLEDRPAVGRLTVELIEALALPSVDIVNGNVDPYVRATITGYDRDMKWTLRQWL